MSWWAAAADSIKFDTWTLKRVYQNDIHRVVLNSSTFSGTVRKLVRRTECRGSATTSLNREYATAARNGWLYSCRVSVGENARSSRIVREGPEAPVRIELTNSRFAVCRLTTWPRRRAPKLSGSHVPDQSRDENPKQQADSQDDKQRNSRKNDCANGVASSARR